MDTQSNKYSRLKAIYSKEKLEDLSNSTVAVIGLGGVGSYCAAALVRGGIGNLILIDFDKIEESNINRQLFATEKTLGNKKVDVAEKILSEINSDVAISKYDEKVCNLNLEELIANVDYIVDAIDDVPDNISLAKFAEEKSIPIVSCMGTAMKKDASKLKFADIYETSVCPLCKSFRKVAKENKIKNLEVLFSTETPTKPLTKELGSTSYLPPIAGMMLAGKVIESI